MPPDGTLVKGDPLVTRFVRTLTLAAALVATPALAPAVDLPAVVVQVQPVGKVLADVKTAARMVGGDPAAGQVDDWLRQQLGEKGFEGLDLTRPVLAYPILKDVEKVDDNTPMVLVAPVTGEAEFIDFLKRTKSAVEPVEGQKGLYRVTSPKGEAGEGAGGKAKGPSLLRFHNGHAYAGEVPAEHLETRNLVPPDKIVMAGENGLVTVRVYFDRLPEDVRKKAGEGIDKALRELKNAPVPDGADELTRKAAERGQQFATRLLSQLKDAKEGVARLRFDTESGEASLEFGLTGRAGTGLADSIRGLKPSTNRFAAAVGKETAAALLWSPPIFRTEFGEIFAMGLDEGARKELDQQDEKIRPVLKELVGGAARTVRAGELDIALVANGPDQNGQFAAVAAVSFADPSKLEKELRALFEKEAPPPAKEMVKLDAAKVGGVSVHVVTPPPGSLPSDVTAFGPTPAAGIAFAPRGILVAFGPDPVAALKPVLGAEPKAARVFGVAVNPGRVRKLAAGLTNEQNAAEAGKYLGTADELFSVLFADLTGGDELRVRLGFNLKLLGPAVGRGAGLSADAGGPVTEKK